MWVGVEANRAILAVVVLYRVRAEESVAFRELRNAVDGGFAAGRQIELMVCDNTPFEQQAPPGFNGIYCRDTTNPGLASCYNRALGRAVQAGTVWLMLLDQDTSVTGEYLAEVMQLTQKFEQTPDIVALVPKLVDGQARGLSPHPPPGLRHHGADLAYTGVAPAELCAFNSGAVLRVASLGKIGGFREDFWLDFLDHVTFRQLQAGGGRVYVMKSTLHHELTLSTPKNPGFSVLRHRSSVDAECRYYGEFGTPRERLFLKVRLILSAFSALLKRGDFRRAAYVFGAAVGRSPLRSRREGSR